MAALDLEPIRQQQTGFHEAVIQERNASLYPERHAVAVFVAEQVRQVVGGGVEPELARQQSTGPRGRFASPWRRRTGGPADPPRRQSAPVQACRNRVRPDQRVAERCAERAALRHDQPACLQGRSRIAKRAREAHGLVSDIASQQLVGALAVEEHLHARFVGDPHDVVLGDDARRAERFILSVQNARQRLEEKGRVGGGRVEIDPSRRHDRVDVRTFVDPGLPELGEESQLRVAFALTMAPTWGEQVAGAQRGGNAHDRGTIEASGQARADGDVRSELKGDRVDQERLEFVDPVLVPTPAAKRRVGRKRRRRPVAVPAAPGRGKHERMGSREALDIPKEGLAPAGQPAI